MPRDPPTWSFPADLPLPSASDEASRRSGSADDDDAELDVDGPVRKRAKLAHDGGGVAVLKEEEAVGMGRRKRRSGTGTPSLRSLERAVSPPFGGRAGGAGGVGSETETEDEDDAEARAGGGVEKVVEEQRPEVLEIGRGGAVEASSTAALGVGRGGERETTFVPSPIQLTRIRDLPDAANVDAVTLKGILCDPLILEIWQFNYLFDVDFLMGALDEDVRGSVRVKVVHGSWRREDRQRQLMEAWKETYPNLEVIQAYMPEAFGTHHSKMMILIRADDYAQVVIHTANMISKDWTNMTNAVWRSPLLPLLSTSAQARSSQGNNTLSSTIKRSAKNLIGSGERFKIDLLRYLTAYGKRLNALTEQLVHYDFSAVRAALVASTPSRVKLNAARPDKQTSWGWVGLREVLRQIPTRAPAQANEETQQTSSTLVAQVSSIATLDQSGTWLEHFRNVLSTHNPSTSSPASTKTTSPKTVLYSALNPPSSSTSSSSSPPLRIIFPSVNDVRASLDGYYAGASIHLKTQSATQQKQLTYLRPLLCRWNTSSTNAPQHATANARRSAAAPHVKTYVRYEHACGAEGVEGPVPGQTRIAWAMLTSANVSTQAWGALPAAGKEGDGERGRKKRGAGADEAGKEVRVCSWEIGVVVWPELLAGERDAVMVPVFGRNEPGRGDVRGLADGGSGHGNTVVGWRLPYDLPLTPYRKADEAWCATARYGVPDVKGCVWEGF